MKRKLVSSLRWYARQGFLFILTAAILLEATVLVQYLFARQGLRREAVRRAESELTQTRLEITGMLDLVESAVNNNHWAAEAMLRMPDSLFSITEQIIRNNPAVYGSAIALRPGQYRGQPTLFSPYSFRTADGVTTRHLGSADYDYTQMEWYVRAAEDGYWSEPYFDVGGGDVFMTTYSVPLKDRKGRQVGVLTADLQLDDLPRMIGGRSIYPDAYTVLMSREGRLMVCPSDSLRMKATLAGLAAAAPDSLEMTANAREILSGRSGNLQVTEGGRVLEVFYAPVERTGWSMAVVIPQDEIYHDVNRLRLAVLLFHILGLCLLIFILYRTARGSRKLRSIEEKKERMENELLIAGNIQKAMLPKIYPPFPDRDDLDIYGAVYPAKEVGGDLYDFYIRDGRLLFCIGDVSGKGVPASLVMAVTRSLFRSVSAYENSPGRIVSLMNESMAESNDSDMFVTFFLGILDLGSGRLRYCNAGHNAPLVIGADGAVRTLPVQPNLALGVLEDAVYSSQSTALKAQETLFLFTDGVTEAENGAHELFGDARLQDALAGNRPDSTRSRVDTLVRAIRDFTAGAPQSDDVTLLGIRYLGSALGECSERRIRLQNDVRQIPRLANFVGSLATEADLDQSLALQINLALEEAVSNVIMYAYPEGSDGLVDVEATIRPGELSFTISDSGRPFDPTAAKEADITLSAEERPVGGLGIHLVRQIMDTVSYVRKDGRNILTVTKKI